MITNSTRASSTKLMTTVRKLPQANTHADLLRGVERGAGGHVAGQHVVLVAEVDTPAGHRVDHGQEHVLDQRVDDPAERSADDHADGKVDRIALDREVAELLHERRHGFSRCRWNGARGAGSDRFLARLAGADADDLLDVGDEDLAVADLAGARGLDDRLDRALDQRVADDHLDLHLGQEVDDVLGAAIELGVALLAPEALDLGHGEAR